jgi:hypothetical protein
MQVEIRNSDTMSLLTKVKKLARTLLGMRHPWKPVRGRWRDADAVPSLG